MKSMFHDPRMALLAVAIWLLSGAGVAFAQATPDAATIARKGNGEGAPPCASCHGDDGAGQAASGFPRLAGLNAAYFEQQLKDLADGSRENAIMQPIAKAMSKDERKALAEYYAKMPLPDSVAHGAKKPPDDPLGKQLAQRGRWADQVPGCVACHGPHGVGVGAHFPPLAGQPASYITSQLDAWKKGTRHNDPLDLMKHVASQLSGKDIKAVADWFAAQPASVKQATQSQGDTP